jgi:Arc/MetJ-type ribon-helix-helix transcriptional regulator
MKENIDGKKAEKKRKYVVKMRCAEGEDAEKIKDKIMMELGETLEGRSNVVMTRLNDEDLKQIDALVEVEVFKSRSEAAAFLIKEGMQACEDLFQKVTPTVEKIRELKEQAKKSLSQKRNEP